ncbi:MAG: hypothetical protein EOO12_12940 [Chitinophagaceae bacterium]|nr:MAG: hypothetical protein EOO12_12940 [Chitinophagaceae bacterium]
MTDTSLGLSLSQLKSIFRATRERLEAAESDPSIDKRALYRELKNLQYEISIKEVTSVRQEA